MTDFNLSEELKKYMDSVSSALESGGVEPLVREGILRDLSAQISEMSSVEGISDSEILARLDLPEAYIETPAASPPESRTAQVPAKAGVFARIAWDVLNIAAVVGSFLAVLLEAVWGLGSAVFEGSPTPTKLHLFLLIPVPFVIAWGAWAVKQPSFRRPRAGAFVNGYLVALGAFYSAAFLPLLADFFGGVLRSPFSLFNSITILFSLLFLAVALVIISPFLAFAAGCVQCLRLGRLIPEGSRRAAIRLWFAGAAMALVLLGGWEGYRFLTARALTLAVHGTGDEMRAGVSDLRRLGTRRAVLESCYGRHAMPRSVYFMYWRARGDSYTPAEYQTLYYRMTGRDFRDERRPSSQADWREENFTDGEIGGDAVGASVRRLEMTSAAVDISAASSPDGLDAGASVAYAEMTMEFLNHSDVSREARCQIILPPGGVASRLTLWIDGEEKEAAFGNRSDVREAYRDVAVVRRRDPALLTTAGPDRVLLQCFPILPRKTMKVKVGFTLPLIPEGERSALVLPYIAERNFSYAEGMTVNVWAESNTPLFSGAGGSLIEETVGVPASPGVLADPARPLYAVRGKIAPGSLSSSVLYLASPKPGDVYRAEFAGVAGYSAISETSLLQDRFVAVVLDTSASMAGQFSPIEDWDGFDWHSVLENLPDSARVALFAGDLRLSPMDRDAALREWPDALKRVKFEGADEQVGNLERAWDLCAGERNSAVLWVHGKLPLDIADTSGLEQRTRRRPNVGESGSPQIFSLQVIPGPNRLEEKLPGVIRLTSPGSTVLEERLSRVLSMALYPGMKSQEQIFSLQSPSGRRISESSSHAVRLAYANEIARYAASGEKIPDEVRERAREMRLVTYATGAVVLENA